jgi:hypothetical protein
MQLAKMSAGSGGVRMSFLLSYIISLLRELTVFLSTASEVLVQHSHEHEHMPTLCRQVWCRPADHAACLSRLSLLQGRYNAAEASQNGAVPAVVPLLQGWYNTSVE